MVIPALKYNWLSSFYDFIMQKLMKENKFKQQLIDQSRIEHGYRVLDLGCGTATLTMMIKTLHPEAEVVGLDGDAKILKIARKKIQQSELDIELKQGLAFEMDFEDKSFDRVLSSLLFHHLTPRRKRKALKEVYRVLKPGAELHIADWGKPQNALMRSAFFLVQLLDGFATTTENVQGKLPFLLKQVGFQNVAEKKKINTVFGSLSFYCGLRI